MENKKFNIYKVLLVLVLIFIVILAYLFSVRQSNINYENALNSYPSEYYVKEEMEDIFISTDVAILNEERGYDYVLYLVLVDSEYCYLVAYKIECVWKVFISYYEWKYFTHRIII